MSEELEQETQALENKKNTKETSIVEEGVAIEELPLEDI